MAYASVPSRSLQGMDAPAVSVEVHLANGLPSLTLVGLPETEVKEARDRVRAAIVNCGFEFPTRRITVNLAPADLPKESGRFDLPIALGILIASGQLPHAAIDGCEFAGELSLSGALRPVRGALAMVLQAADQARAFVLPAASAGEAVLAGDVTVFGAASLLEVCAHLLGQQVLSPATRHAEAAASVIADLADVRGQQHAKRALEIAAAGGHSLLMSGPPGSGKSMLAHRLPSLLPPLEPAEARVSAAVLSLAGPFPPEHFGRPPVRAPHHSASMAALIGGGNPPRPGEASLATHGILFLDELPEFSRKTLESLREPLETGEIHISRAARQAVFPARFQLVAAMNPCPCGWLGHTSGRCQCTPEQVRRYRARISGPLFDRIDLHVDVPAVPVDALQQRSIGDSSATVRARVITARQLQRERQQVLNHALAGSELDRCCPLADGVGTLLAQASERLQLSARSYHRILRVARTIADLAASPVIARQHAAEAIQYRRQANNA